VVFKPGKRGSAKARLRARGRVSGALAISDTTTAPEAREEIRVIAETQWPAGPWSGRKQPGQRGFWWAVASGEGGSARATASTSRRAMSARKLSIFTALGRASGPSLRPSARKPRATPCAPQRLDPPLPGPADGRHPFLERPGPSAPP